MFKPAPCHPLLRHEAKGLCKPCYNKAWKKENPEKEKAIQKRARQKNQVAIKAGQKRWREQNPEKHREGKRRRDARGKVHKRAYDKIRKSTDSYRDYLRVRNYGITKQQYDAMHAQQNGLCAICRKAEARDTDHIHGTKIVRGLLCRQCNILLGMAHEDPAVLSAAAAYLEQRHSVKEPWLVYA